MNEGNERLSNGINTKDMVNLSDNIERWTPQDCFLYKKIAKRKKQNYEAWSKVFLYKCNITKK